MSDMRQRLARTSWLWAAAAAAGAGGVPASDFELLGETVIERRMDGSELPVGGLSGLAFDPASGTFFAVSDDPSRLGPARIYEIAIDLENGRLEADGVRLVGVTTLRQADGTPFRPHTIDAEGLARTPQGHWLVASEGFVERGVPPALFEFTAAGAWVGALRLPRALRLGRHRGPRHNLAFESVTVSPDGEWLFSATENALLQDGGAADAAGGSLCRILQFELGRRRLRAAYAYRTEPVAGPPRGDELAVNGLVDLLALEGRRLLALERSFTAGQGNVVRLFHVDLAAATDVARSRRLDRLSPGVPARKTLLLDIADLGVRPDNLEGMAFGPNLADGRRTLFLVADDNFAPQRQRNQLIALAVAGRALAGAAE